MKALFKREKLASGKAVNETNVTGVIDEGGKGMPGYKDSLDDAARKALLDYLKSL